MTRKDYILIADVERAQESRAAIEARLVACVERCRVFDELRTEEYARREELIRGAIVAGFTRAQVSRTCGLTTGRMTQLLGADACASKEVG